MGTWTSCRRRWIPSPTVATDSSCTPSSSSTSTTGNRPEPYALPFTTPMIPMRIDTEESRNFTEEEPS
ncbi:hypothetical protein E2C01_005287 [Portunus trituberculatus]|uniref:Uncharacterized protein n=1 Tax=Portunus trituberculatus TaxID=210409 RepID=A0A5B7CTM4_PORTR|nr:hypothetical protein [Portunus trituberculatus]